MSELIKWSDIAFYIKPTSIRGVKDISIEAGSETEDSTVDGEKFVKRKNGNPYNIGMTAILDARLGETVQNTALQLTEAARCSKTGYFYTGGAKLFPSQFMMVSAKISNLIMNGKGVWISCEVALTLKQCSKFDGGTTSGASSSAGSSGGSTGSGSSSSSGSKKVSTKTTSTSTPKVTDALISRNMQDYSTKASKNFQSAVNAALNKAKTQSQNIVVKAATAAKTSTSNKVSTVSGVKKNTKNMLK